jgi:hypothetical protein
VSVASSGCHTSSNCSKPYPPTSPTQQAINGVSTLDTRFADPDMEALRQKVNEMILNGRR